MLIISLAKIYRLAINGPGSIKVLLTLTTQSDSMPVTSW